jgi:hypothetical protein
LAAVLLHEAALVATSDGSADILGSEWCFAAIMDCDLVGHVSFLLLVGDEGERVGAIFSQGKMA